MYNKGNIIIMSKLAVYDETMSDKDYHKNQYFRHDYIYRQNKWVRFFVLLGSLILVGFYILHMLAIDNKDIMTMVATRAYVGELYKIGVFIISLQVAYTIIGTIIYTTQYEQSQKRLEKYFQLVDELERRNIAISKKRAELAKAHAAAKFAEDDKLIRDDLDFVPSPVNYVPANTAARPDPSRPVSRASDKSLVYTKTAYSANRNNK